MTKMGIMVLIKNNPYTIRDLLGISIYNNGGKFFFLIFTKFFNAKQVMCGKCIVSVVDKIVVNYWKNVNTAIKRQTYCF